MIRGSESNPETLAARRSCFVLTLVVLFACAALLPRVNEASHDGLAFVNLERVIERYDKAKTFRDELSGRIGKRFEELNERTGELQGEEEELQFLNPLGEDYRSRRIDLTVEMERVRLERDSLQEQYRRAIVASYPGVFADITEEIASLAKERSYAGVLQVGGPPLTGKERTMDEVFLKLKLEHVLYHDKKLDITEEIIERLNK